MAKPYELPIVQKDASGNLQRATATNENYLAFKAGVHLAGTADHGGTIRSSSVTNDTAIGSFTNTFYNEPVGTHPGSSLSIGSTTTTLYQRSGSASIALDDTVNFRRPVYETSTQIHDFDSDQMHDLSHALRSIVVSNEYPGSYRLASSAPSGDWSAHLTNIFSDTTTDGTVTNYTIWERQTGTAPTKCNAIHIKRGSYGAYPLAAYDGGLEAMSDTEQSTTFGQILSRHFVHGDAGTYELRSSAQGAPVATGTWEARGTAVDTRYTTASQNYAGDRSYSSQYTGPQNYSGVRDVSFSGPRAANFTGPQPANFAGPQPNNFVGPQPANFAGPQPTTFSGPRAANFAGPTPTNYLGVRNVNFAGVRTVNFLGVRNVNYLGVRNVNYLGVRNVNFGGFVNVNYVGPQPANFAGTSSQPGNFAGSVTVNFAGTRSSSQPGTFTGGVAIYGGDRQFNWSGRRVVLPAFGGYRNPYVGFYTSSYQYFSANYAGPLNAAGYPANHPINQFSGTGYWAGTRTVSSPGNFSGPQPTNFAGVRTVPANYAGFVNVNYVGPAPTNFVGPQPANFVGPAPANFAGPAGINFSGPQPANFSGPQPANFLGVSIVNFAGVRNSNFGGVSNVNFLGARNVNFGGVRTVNFSGVRDVSFSGVRDANFTGPQPQSFTGVAQFAGVRTFSTQFAGDTLIATPANIETYTLYVRVS
jgi:hypothetical protein